MTWVSAEHWRGRRVLVTGATGFLGAWVSQALVESGAEVHGTGHQRTPLNVHHAHRAYLPRDAAAVVEHSSPEVIFHLASPIVMRPSPAQVDTLKDEIVGATEALLSAASAAGARLVHVGTCAEYGDAPAPHKEEGPAQPTNPYGVLKLEATRCVQASPVAAAVVRPFRAIGPGDTASVVAAAAKAALTGSSFEMTEGSQVREWNHAQAIATGIVAAGAHPGAVGQVINLGGGESRSVYDVVRAVFEAAGASASLIRRGARPQRLGEVALLTGRHSRATALWGSIPQPSLDETIAQAVAWMRAQIGDAA